MYELAMIILAIGVIFIAVAAVSASKLHKKNHHPIKGGGD
jgi:hypothetical protein